MPFQIAIDPKDRKAAFFIDHVREEIVRAYTAKRDGEGMTQSDVADKLGLGRKNRSIISRIFSGEHNLTLRSLAHLAWALGQDIEFKLVPEERHRPEENEFPGCHGLIQVETKILSNDREPMAYIGSTTASDTHSSITFSRVLEPA